MKKRQKGIRVAVAFALVAAAGLAGYAVNRAADPDAPRTQGNIAGAAAGLAGVFIYTVRRRNAEIARLEAENSSLKEDNNRLRIESFRADQPLPPRPDPLDVTLDHYLPSRGSKIPPPGLLN